MVYLGRPQTPQSVAEALGTGAIPAAILVAHSHTIRMEGTARTPEERLGQGLHSFLAHLVLGEVPVPSLEQVTLFGFNPDVQVHRIHLLLSIRVNVYSAECRLFACLGELPAKGLPPVMEILPDFFATWHSVCTVPRVNHIAHLGGISPLDGQTKPCEWAVGTEQVNLACWNMAFFPAYCADWLLWREADGPFNVFEASAGLFLVITGQ